MSFVDDLLPTLDAIRAIPGDLGLHPFTVTRVTKTWASGTVGHGSATTTEQALTVGGQNPHVRNATEDEIKHLLGAGSLFKPGTLLVGPLTPEFAGGGYDVDGFDASSGVATQVLYRVTGAGFPAAGRLYRVAKFDASRPMRITMVLEPASNAPAR